MINILRRSTVFVFVIIGLLTFTACATKRNTSYNGSQNTSQSTPPNAPQTLEAGQTENYEQNYIATNDKKVKTGNGMFRSDNFDWAIAEIKTMVEINGGYFEDFSLNKISSKSTPRFAKMRIRVPSENYELVKDFFSEVAELDNFNDMVSDVSQKYNDIQSRLTTKKAEKARLLEFMEKAEKIEDKIILEEHLSELSQIISNYEASLVNINSSISYSTLDIRLEEYAEGVVMKEEVNLGSRAVEAFEASLNFVAGFFKAIVVLVAYVSVPMIIIITTVGVGILGYKRFKGRTPKPSSKG